MNVELMRLDLASLESTKNFIENFKQKNLPLHMLICNAGIAMVPHGKKFNLDHMITVQVIAAISKSLLSHYTYTYQLYLPLAPLWERVGIIGSIDIIKYIYVPRVRI